MRTEDVDLNENVLSGGATKAEAAAAFVEAVTASKLRLKDKLLALLAARPEIANRQDAEGRTLLHHVAEHSEGVEELLSFSPDISCTATDRHGDTPLHLSAATSCPMSAYAIAKASPASCLVRNKEGQTAADIANLKSYGEVLNAMLLACCSTEANPKDSSQEALEAIEMLLEAGAVPDTWAPNGNSALMMAASADSPLTIAKLLKKNAQINMKDTLGRTALMFAAGNDSRAALVALMDAGGQGALSLQDNRGNNVLKYASGEATRQLVEQRFAELEAAAHANEAALLASLEAEEQSAATARQKRAHRGKKKKKAGKGAIAVSAALAEDQSREADGAECDDATEQPGSPTPLGERLQSSTPAPAAKSSGEGITSGAQLVASEVDKRFQQAAAAFVCINGDTQPASGQLDVDPQLGGQPTTVPPQLCCTGTLHPEAAAENGRRENGHAGPPQQEGEDPQEQPLQALEPASLTDMSYEDRLAIVAALRSPGLTNGTRHSEQSWQEVKKPGKMGPGKPPLGRKGAAEKACDGPHSLMPSSSSVSLDSLGDSSASGASALSFPSVYPVHLQKGRGVDCRKTSDPVICPPIRGEHPPKAILKPSAAVLPNMSWVNVVQGKAGPESNSALGPQEAVTGVPAEEGQAAESVGAPHGAEPGSAEAPQANGIEVVRLPVGHPITIGEPDRHNQEVEALRREVGALRQQLSQAESGRAQLAAALAAAHEEHRLLLQQAVEDTARNVVQQERLRAHRQIEALQLLVLQTHAALRGQPGMSLMPPPQAIQVGHVATGRHRGARQLQPSSPRQSSPQLSVSPSGSSLLGSPKRSTSRPLRGSFEGTAGVESGRAAATPSRGREPSERSQDWPPLQQPPAGVAAFGAANPWADAREPPAAHGDSLPNRPLLPSLDSIWGPTAALQRAFQPPPLTEF